MVYKGGERNEKNGKEGRRRIREEGVRENWRKRKNEKMRTVQSERGEMQVGMREVKEGGRKGERSEDKGAAKEK